MIGDLRTVPSDGSTFAPGLRLLPDEVRADASRLYRFLRSLDDLVDEDRPEAPQRVEAVERWARGEEHAATHETRILEDLSRRHTLPRQAFLDFCQGMRHDMTGGVIHTEEDLELYSQRVAGTVGIILARILGSSRPEKAEEKMAALGRAMQRTNILRDIDEDAAHGRVYIPSTAIERYGAPIPGKRAELLRDQIARADALFEEAAAAPSLLARGGSSMALSTTLYREILRQIERDGFGRTPGRAVVPGWRKRLLIARHRLGRG